MSQFDSRCSLLALSLASAWPLVAGAGESDGERLLRRVLDARTRDCEVHFSVKRAIDEERVDYRCWCAGEWLRYEVHRPPASSRLGSAARGPVLTDQATIADFARGTDEQSAPGAVYVFRRRQMAPFQYHPQQMELGWPRSWTPSRPEEALFAGMYGGGRMVSVTHRLVGRERRQGRPVTVVDASWTPIDGEPAARIRRYVDEERGPSVIDAEVYLNDQLDYRRESRLRDWSGVWFPERVTGFVQSAQGETIDVEITVKRANFDRVDRKLFTTESFGLEPGMSIITIDRGVHTTRVWSGKSEVSFEEFARLEKAGLVEPGPKLRKARAEAERLASQPAQRPSGPLPPTLPSGRLDMKRAGDALPSNWLHDALLPPDLWERYVDQVAISLKFDVNRKRAAQGILKEMRGRAEAYRASRAADYKKAEALPDAKQREAELDRLEQGVDELFKELKDRVERL